MRRFHRWYDKLKEPWRLIFALSLVMPGFMFINSSYGRLQLLGWAYLIIILSSSIWVVYFPKKKDNL